MPHHGSWLYDRIDTFEITEVGQAEVLLKDAGLKKDLRARASEVPFRPTPLPSSQAPTWRAQEHTKGHE